MMVISGFVLSRRKKEEKMNKKILFVGILGCLGLLGVILFISLGWYFLWDKGEEGKKRENADKKGLVEKVDFEKYENMKYGYSFSYPDGWYAGYLGDSEKMAEVVWFSPNEDDSVETMGGTPIAVKFEVIVFDLPEMKKEAGDFPKIGSIKEWISWQRSEWGEMQKEAIGEYKDKDVVINGQAGVLTYFYPPEEGMLKVKSWEVQVYDPGKDRVYLLKYYGQEPVFGEYEGEVDRMFESFSF